MKKKIGKLYYHEALDRSYLIIQMVEDYLIKHPATNAHPEIKEKIEKAQELLSEAYQDFGQF